MYKSTFFRSSTPIPHHRLSSSPFDMKTSALFTLFASLALTSFTTVIAQDSNVTETIVANAEADSIDLTILSFYNSALTEIETVYEEADISTVETTKRSVGRFIRRQTPTPNDIVDVHTHVVPSWYKLLVPTTGGNPTPDWTLAGHLSFMEQQGIARAILAFSAPGANVYQGNKPLTVSLARLINEQSAAYCRANPTKLDFYAVVPLPYTTEAIREARYAVNVLGAVGIVLTSNYEGTYLGNVAFKPFFEAVNSFGGRQIFYIHPSAPYVKVNNKLVEANPTPYPTGNIEFFFETSRTLMDLTLTQTIHNFTNIHYVIPHVGGAFPATIDRILKSTPAIYDSSLNIYSTRFWWDSAGPTYFHQVAGLLGFGIPKSQLLYGTDYPYAPAFTQAGSLNAVKNSALFTAVEKTAIFRSNAVTLFGNKIKW
ncbi:hypothetical protein BDQ12DRAFT_686809 [Crucibulum laeve]|uniref:Amidohydrolase-related domain-containing protein n=1 Tax=Crucibulum laeve TaxID=68775 RepID=A0A5C3LVF1_9AGAR|nr:hypothetical protein BDQ12DRAFT_686809 [Crucibulum laeve]